MNPALAIVLLVAAQRLAELLYGQRNARRLLAEGAIEAGSGHYPILVLVHAGWLMALLIVASRAPAIDWWLLGLYGLLQLGRLWVLASLGRYWTTRLITLAGAPLVRGGPYRFLRHPNHLVVMAEVAPAARLRRLADRPRLLGAERRPPGLARQVREQAAGRAPVTGPPACPRID